MRTFRPDILVETGSRPADTTYQGPQIEIPRWDSAANTVTFGIALLLDPAIQEISVNLRGSPDLLASAGGPVIWDRHILTATSATATWVLNNSLYWAIWPNLDRYPLMRVTIGAVPASTSQSILPFLLA